MWRRFLDYWTPFTCDGCGKTKPRTLSDDGRQILCRKCRKDPEYKEYLKTEFGF